MSFASISKKLGASWMVIASICFALMGLFIKLAGDHYNFVELVFWRGVFGIVFIGSLATIKKRTLKTTKLKQHLIRSISGLCAMLAYFYVVTKLPLATAMTLNYTSPISMVILSAILYKEKISSLTIIGIIIGFIGIILLLQPNFSSDMWIVVLIGVASGAVSGWAYLQVQLLTRLNEPDWRIVFYFSVVLTVIPALILTVSGSWNSIEVESLFYLISMALFATLAQLCMTKSYAVGNKFLASSLSYLTIVFAVILGALVLHDVLHWIEVLAMIVIVASGFITNLGKKA